MADKATAEKVTNKVATEPAAAEKPVSAAEKTSGAADKLTEHRPVLAHDKRKALGRGLESLLGSLRAATHPAGPGASAASSATAPTPTMAAAATTTAAAATTTVPTTIPVGDGSAGRPVGEAVGDIQAVGARRKPDDHEVIDLLIDLIDVNPHQTRTFTKDELESLQELSESIKVQGVIQPVTVRPGKDGRFS
jgi:hypothetical protein